MYQSFIKDTFNIQINSRLPRCSAKNEIMNQNLIMNYYLLNNKTGITITIHSRKFYSRFLPLFSKRILQKFPTENIIKISMKKNPTQNTSNTWVIKEENR